MIVNKLRDIMFSGGDQRYIGHLGKGYVGLIGLFAILQKRVLTCEEREFSKLPTPSKEEQEYLENEIKHARPTHDPDTAKEVIRTIWHVRNDLPICKSWKEVMKWLDEGKSFSLYFVMIEPWYSGGRADVGLVMGDKQFPDRYQTSLAVEIGDVYINKPLEAFQAPTMEELWVVPYPGWLKPLQNYYVFKRGINWGKPKEGKGLKFRSKSLERVRAIEDLADYFGVLNCDLSKNCWWAAYIRQSLEEQSYNNRLPEYLLTCAREAKKLGIIITPQEYILYDLASSEHLQRPKINYLGSKLIPSRKIQGVIVPALDRLSRIDLMRQVFEYEASHFGVKVEYCDAPSGSDPASQLVRIIMTSAAKFVLRANRKNNLGDNMGRVLRGNVPAGKVAYGYKYRSEFDPETGKLIRAWWEINSLNENGEIIEGSPAWVIQKIFHWIGIENKTTYWAAMKLNEIGIKPPLSEVWSPSKIGFLIRHRCYTGRNAYNTGRYEVNPERPLTDITAKPLRTIRKPKPEENWVWFEVPSLVSESLWQAANENLNSRKGRGPWKETFEALCRRRIFCPKCGRAMRVRRDSRSPRLLYYSCTTRHEPWNSNRCGMRYVRLDWCDELVWARIAQALKNPELIAEQLRCYKEEMEVSEIQKKIHFLTWKINSLNEKIRRIQDDYENSIYTADEAKIKIVTHRSQIEEAEKLRAELEETLKKTAEDEAYIKKVKETLKEMCSANIDSLTFEEKQRIMEILDAKVYPREDLSGLQVVCRVNLEDPEANKALSSRYKTSIASPKL